MSQPHINELVLLNNLMAKLKLLKLIKEQKRKKS